MESVEIYIDELGYERIADTNQLVHRVIAFHEIYLENRLDYPFPFSKYVVHHIDGDKLNNDVSNLAILLPEEHAEIHGKPIITSTTSTTLTMAYEVTEAENEEEGWSIGGYELLLILGILFFTLILAFS